MKILFVLFSVFLFIKPVMAAEVYIDKAIAIPMATFEESVSAGGLKQNKFLKPPLIASDRYLFHVFINSDTFDEVSVFLCDDYNFQKYKKSLKTECQGVHRGKKHFKFVGKPVSNTNHFLIIDNRSGKFGQKYVTILPTRFTKMDDKVHEIFTNDLKYLTYDLMKPFEVSDRDTHLISCRQKKVKSDFNSKHVMGCTELFYYAYAEKQEEVIEASFLHELGHSMLKEWGIPEWDSELVADEFVAAYLTLVNREETLIYWIEWLKTFDRVNPDFYKIRKDEKEVSAIERALILEDLRSDRAALVDKWIELIYKNYTFDMLKLIIIGKIDNPFDNREIAKKVFLKRYPEYEVD